MNIGVISDTHDQIDQIKRAVEILNQERVALVVHCGDWVAPFVLLPLKKLRCPIKGVFGNNDGDPFRHLAIAKRENLDVTYEKQFMKLALDGRAIAVYHGDSDEIVQALVTCRKYDAVFHGHTHVSVNETMGKTLSLNPGTLLPETDPRKKGASFAIYDTKTNTARLVNL